MFVVNHVFMFDLLMGAMPHEDGQFETKEEAVALVDEMMDESIAENGAEGLVEKRSHEHPELGTIYEITMFDGLPLEMWQIVQAA